MIVHVDTITTLRLYGMFDPFSTRRNIIYQKNDGYELT